MEKINSTSTWKGVPLESLNRVPSEGVEDQYPPISPSPHHTVCIKLPLPSTGCPLPHPPILQDVWDKSHVRMPWSKKNLYESRVFLRQGGEVDLCSRWELIKHSLSDRRIKNPQDLERVIMVYNKKYEGNPDWSFRGLDSFIRDVQSPDETRAFLDETLPQMVKLLIKSPELMTCPLLLLSKDTKASITLSQQQISVLLINAFFCTFPWRNDQGKGSEYSSYPSINFNRLFGMSSKRPKAIAGKLKCFFNYFQQVLNNPPTGLVTFTRQSIPKSNTPRWSSSNCSLPRLHISSTGTIEVDGEGMLQVDFAAARVGGGVLDEGMVQEEIRFSICPELIVSRLFTQRLGDNEVLIISGVERFSYYSGYANTFKFTGPYYDQTKLDSSRRKHTSIVAMNALYFSKKFEQYSNENVDRELGKAFAGFHNGDVKEGERLVGVATGNWGCGAFGGDARLKSLLQMLAAAEAGRDVAYFTFGDDKLRDDVFSIYTFLVNNNINVGSVYRAIVRFCETRQILKGIHLYDYLYQVIGADMTHNYSVLMDHSTTASSASGSEGDCKTNEREHVIKTLQAIQVSEGKDISSRNKLKEEADISEDVSVEVARRPKWAPS